MGSSGAAREGEVISHWGQAKEAAPSPFATRKPASRPSIWSSGIKNCEKTYLTSSTGPPGIPAHTWTNRKGYANAERAVWAACPTLFLSLSLSHLLSVPPTLFLPLLQPFNRAPLPPGRVTFEKRVFGFFRDDQRAPQKTEGVGRWPANAVCWKWVKALAGHTCVQSRVQRLWKNETRRFLAISRIWRIILAKCEMTFRVVLDNSSKSSRNEKQLARRDAKIHVSRRKVREDVVEIQVSVKLAPPRAIDFKVSFQVRNSAALSSFR